MLRIIMRNVKYQVIPYPSEVIVADEKGKTIVKCPTEQEASEYIKELEEEAREDSSFAINRKVDKNED